jgi:hypothetical protein
MFILFEKDRWGTDYYKGGTYIKEGGCYPITGSLESEAKVYTSKLKAGNACKKLNNKVGRCFKIKERINT